MSGSALTLNHLSLLKMSYAFAGKMEPVGLYNTSPYSQKPWGLQITIAKILKLQGNLGTRLSLKIPWERSRVATEPISV